MLKNSLFQPSLSFSFSAAVLFLFLFLFQHHFFFFFLPFFSFQLTCALFFSPKTFFSTQNNSLFSPKTFFSAQTFFSFSAFLQPKHFLLQFNHSSLLLFFCFILFWLSPLFSLLAPPFFLFFSSVYPRPNILSSCFTSLLFE